MWRILLIESGDYLYKVNGGGYLYSKFETNNELDNPADYVLFEAETKREAKHALLITLRDSHIYVDDDGNYISNSISNFEFVKVVK